MLKDSFEAFLTENENRIYNYILRFVDVDDDAHDLVQNVFIAFYKRIEKIEEKTALAYLYRMAHNSSIDWQKQRRRYVLKAPEAFHNLPEKTEKPESHDLSTISKAIAALPVKLSTVIHLQYFDRLSYKDISTKLGISIKTVDSHLVKAKNLLRKNLVKDNRGNYVLKDK